MSLTAQTGTKGVADDRLPRAGGPGRHRVADQRLPQPHGGSVLHHFLTEHRGTLIQRCRARVSARRAPVATPAELEYGIPIFLDQLTGMLARDANSAPHAAGDSSDKLGPEADAD